MAVAVVTAGGLVIVSAMTNTYLSESRPVRVPSAPPPSTVESLAELPPAAVPPVTARALVAAAGTAVDPGITLGLAVLDVNTGELAMDSGGGRSFMSASLCKLILAVDILDQHNDVDPADLDLITRALSASDDNAMNALWGRYNGPGAIERIADRLGLAETVAPDSATEVWGDTLTSAADLVTIYRHILRDMAPEDSAVITGALATANAVAADGFAQHYGLLHMGASPQRYAKQAWVPYAPAGYLLHSAGVAFDNRTGHRYAVAMLSIQSFASEQVARDRLSAVAAAALAPLSG